MDASEILISKTKVIVPKRRVELLTRPRLLGAINENLDRKLVLVSAPAGYGKTSLLVDLAHHSELPFCWLALDSLDREPQRFLAYFIAAIAERFPKFGKRSRSALNSLTNLESGMESVLVTVINEIYDEIHEHFAFVLDDFHLVDDVEPIVYFINRFIQLADENSHLILSSRTLTNLPDLTLLVAREQVGGISFSELSFRPEEIQALLAQNQQIHLSDQDARKLFEATEGWVTGLQFTDFKAGLRGESAYASPSAVVGVDVFDYLGQQVLEQQPEWLKLFLLRSSLLEEFDAGLCEAVLAPLYETRQDWSKIIDLIIRKNLFTLSVGDEGLWLRYHHLFRDFLQARFRNEHPEETSIIMQRLAQYHEAHRGWEKAYQLYKQLGDFDALVNLIEHAGIFMYQHAMLTLDSWLKEIPPSLFQKRAGLLSLRGAVDTARGNTSEGIEFFDRAIRMFREKGNVDDLALALVRRGNAHRVLGNYQEAFRDADEAMGLTRTDDNLQWIYADALRVKGTSFFRQGQTLQAIPHLEHALDIYTRLDDTEVIPLLLMETGVVYAETGKYSEAQVAYQKALEMWKRSGNFFSQANLLNNSGVLYQRLGNYEEAAQMLEEGLLCAKRSGNKRVEALIFISLGDLFADIEDMEIAQQNYRRAEELAHDLNTTYFRNYLTLAELNLALVKNESLQAHRVLTQALASIKVEDSIYEYGLLQLMKGRLSVLDMQPEQAIKEFQDANECFVQDGRKIEIALSRFWEAAAQAQLGRLESARDEIELVFEESGQTNYSMVIPFRQARRWLEVLRNDPQSGRSLRNLFKKANSLDGQLPQIRRQLHRLISAIEVPTAQFVIHAFGYGNVTINGKTLTMKDWQTQSVRELFFYLLSLKRPMSREQISEALWGSTVEPANLNLRFKNEMYRLRRAVGPDVILFKEDRYQFNPAIDHEYDVEAFEAFIEKAKSCLNPVESISLYQKGTDLVHGHYLEGIDATWVWPEREKLNQDYLWASLALADLYLKEGRTQDALKTCERTLEYDSAFEAAYCLKMKAYRRLGDRGSVIYTYQTCEKVMRNIYNLPPSEETQKLYQELSS